DTADHGLTRAFTILAIMVADETAGRGHRGSSRSLALTGAFYRGSRMLSEPLRSRHGRLGPGRHRAPARQCRSVLAPRAGPVSGVDGKSSDRVPGPAPAQPP